MSRQNQSRMHIIACLEERLGSPNFVTKVSENNRKVIAYFGPKPKPAALAKLDFVTLARCDWTIKWLDASLPNKTKTGEDCGMICPYHSKNDSSLRLPFWRGSGDDMEIQQSINACRLVSRTVPDSFGRVMFNNFRSAIFSYSDRRNGNPDHSFVLTPVIPHEGDELGKRIEQTILLARFLLNAGLEKVRICVLKGSRSSWRKHSPTADITSRQSQILRTNVERWILEQKLSGKVVFLPNDESGEDKDIDFEIESAISKADLIVAFDGSTGNILARTFTYLSKVTELYAIPWFLRDRAWPVGEGAFIGYDWKAEPVSPLKRAIMWKVLEEQCYVI